MTIIFLIIISCFLFGIDDFFEPHFTVGGYGELHYNHKTIDDNSSTIGLDFHRFITFINYNFTEEWSIKSELELEHNFVSEGEGELELEQAYVNYHNGNWGFGAGVLLISAGILNETHEPPTFLSVERPDYNKYIIPTTWFGNGIHFYGSFSDFNIKLVIHEDLEGEKLLDWNIDENNDETIAGFSGGIRDGRGKGYKTSAYSWTKNLSTSYTAIQGLNVGGSYTVNNAPINNNKNNTIGVSLIEIHASYSANNIYSIFEYGMLALKHNDLDDMNGNGYYMDLGYNVAPLISFENNTLIPWVRYGGYTTDDSSDANMINIWKIGMTYKPIDKIVFKAEYGIDTKDEVKTKEFNIGIGYMF